MKYCTHCANELQDAAVICPKCGCPVAATAKSTDDQLLQQLACRVNTNGIIWTVIGVIQILMGLFWNWWILIVGVLNIITGIRDINRSQQLPKDPRGIVREHTPIAGAIITLIYNVVVGAFIGVIGSIYYFIAIRGMVMENKDQFIGIENAYISK